MFASPEGIISPSPAQRCSFTNAGLPGSVSLGAGGAGRAVPAVSRWIAFRVSRYIPIYPGLSRYIPIYPGLCTSIPIHPEPLPPLICIAARSPLSHWPEPAADLHPRGRSANGAARREGGARMRRSRPAAPERWAGLGWAGLGRALPGLGRAGPGSGLREERETRRAGCLCRSCHCGEQRSPPAPSPLLPFPGIAVIWPREIYFCSVFFFFF